MKVKSGSAYKTSVNVLGVKDTRDARKRYSSKSKEAYFQSPLSQDPNKTRKYVIVNCNVFKRTVTAAGKRGSVPESLVALLEEVIMVKVLGEESALIKMKGGIHIEHLIYRRLTLR